MLAMAKCLHERRYSIPPRSGRIFSDPRREHAAERGHVNSAHCGGGAGGDRRFINIDETPWTMLIAQHLAIGTSYAVLAG